MYEYEWRTVEDIGNIKQAVVASNFKVYKTKKQAIAALKKVADVFHYTGSLSSGIPVYDMNGKLMDLTLKTVYKRYGIRGLCF